MFTPFIPTTEAAGVRDPFLTQYPFHAARMGNMQNLPLITSITSEEGLYPAAGNLNLLHFTYLSHFVILLGSERSPDLQNFVLTKASLFLYF